MTTTTLTSSTLKNYLPIIQDTTEPTMEAMHLAAKTRGTLNSKNLPDKFKECLSNGLIGYLEMWTYTDVFKTDHVARTTYCNKLRDTEKDLHSLFCKNKLRYGNMTQVMNLVNIISENREANALLEELGLKVTYEAKNFEEKIKISQKVSSLAEKTCKMILDGSIALEIQAAA